MVVLFSLSLFFLFSDYMKVRWTSLDRWLQNLVLGLQFFRDSPILLWMVSEILWIYTECIYLISIINWLQLLAKMIELEHLEGIHLVFFYLTVNKLITDKTQNIFFSIAEHTLKSNPIHLAKEMGREEQFKENKIMGSWPLDTDKVSCQAKLGFPSSLRWVTSNVRSKSQPDTEWERELTNAQVLSPIHIAIVWICSSTLSLALLSGSLWHSVVVPVRVPSLG